MGRIVVTEFVSLDGVMEGPGGAGDFKYAGWSFEFSRGEEGGTALAAESDISYTYVADERCDCPRSPAGGASLPLDERPVVP
jgi:hypothetical protein